MPDSRYIRAGWLIDGSGSSVPENILIKITNGIIVDISTGFSGAAPSAPEPLEDYSDCTIIPPLVDSHVHLALSPTLDSHVRQRQLATDYEEIRRIITGNMRAHFSCGVLAVRDAGIRQGHVIRAMTELDGDDKPITVKTASAWHKKGRYGRAFAQHLSGNRFLSQFVARETTHFNFIKMINSGINSLTEFAKETAPQFSLPELTETVRLAKRQGKKVMVHANGKIPVQQALQAGCHSIEHGYFMGKENLERMAESGTVWVPTAFVMKVCAEQLAGNDEVSKETLFHQIEQIAQARELGVTIALGTDAGSMGVAHGQAVAGELQMLLEAGFTLPEAIRCATYNGARLLDLDHTMGLVARGKPAIFLAVKGGPNKLLKNITRPDIFGSGNNGNADSARRARKTLSGVFV